MTMATKKFVTTGRALHAHLFDVQAEYDAAVYLVVVTPNNPMPHWANAERLATGATVVIGLDELRAMLPDDVGDDDRVYSIPLTATAGAVQHLGVQEGENS